jgi:hypothetical protein
MPFIYLLIGYFVKREFVPISEVYWHKMGILSISEPLQFSPYGSKIPTMIIKTACGTEKQLISCFDAVFITHLNPITITNLQKSTGKEYFSYFLAKNS